MSEPDKSCGGRHSDATSRGKITLNPMKVGLGGTLGGTTAKNRYKPLIAVLRVKLSRECCNSLNKKPSRAVGGL